MNDKIEVMQTYTNKHKYMDDNGIRGKMRSTLMMITDKTVLLVTSTPEKVVVDKFCEKFGINCTVRLSADEITGKRVTTVIVDEISNENVKNIHFTRMLSRLLDK